MSAVDTRTVDAPAHRTSAIARDARGAASIWRRELVRFFRERVRAVTSFVQPLLYLLVFGTGLGAAVRSETVAGDYREFLLPGVIVMTALFTSMHAAVSIVWDREFGFLKEILVAPLSRSSIIAGKAAGGATTSSMQGLAILVFSPVVGLSFSPLALVEVVPVLVLFALSVNLLGTAIASKITTMQGFIVVLNFIMLPLFFLSGAVFPLNAVPAWLRVLAYLDPATYAVDAIRRALIPEFPPVLTFGGTTLGTGAELGLLAAFGAVMFAFAVRGFRRQP